MSGLASPICARCHTITSRVTDPTVPAERRESTCSSTFSMLVATLTGMAKMSKKEKDYTRHLDEWIETVVDLCPDDKITQAVAHMLFLLKWWIDPKNKFATELGVKRDLDEPGTCFLSDLCDVGINVDQALAKSAQPRSPLTA